MKRIKLHNATTPIVVVKTGGVSAAITAAATVGIFAVTAAVAVKVANSLEEFRTKIDKFIGEKDAPDEVHSKELVKDTLRSKAKRTVAKTFLKNLFN